MLHWCRLMQGVRRWIGSPYHQSNQHKSQARTARKSESKKPSKFTEVPKEVLNHKSTEYMVLQSMDPTVPENEIQEYNGYVWAIDSTVPDKNESFFQLRESPLRYAREFG